MSRPDSAGSDVERLEYALSACQDLQDLAEKYGIDDIFQDNGGKVLQTLILLGLKISPGREGNDAVDSLGNEYELKTVNVSGRNKKGQKIRKRRGVTTHHHLNYAILDKYRKVAGWYVGLYDGIKLEKIYRLAPADLEPHFAEWERWLDARDPGAAKNNPKIPLKTIELRGTVVWPTVTEWQEELLPPSSPLKDDEP